MKNDLLPALRKELENSFGRKVLSSRDCLQMVDDIYQKTGYTINVNTLRRFFGLIKTAYSASPSTLIILLKYCGLNSIDELENMSKETDSDTIVNKEEVIHYLVSLFKNLTVEEYGAGNFLVESVVKQTVIFLERNSFLIDKFQREIAGTPAGQYYYFERSVNMDRLNDYYGDGLRFYLRAKNTNEALVFSHSIQVLRYWLTINPELLEKNMAELGTIPININFPVHILARYIAAKLFFAHVKGEAIDKILGEASKYYAAAISKSGSPNPDFELIVGEALVLTNHYAEGNEYIRRGKSRLSALRGNNSYENVLGFWEKIINSKRNTTLKAIITPLKPGLINPLSTSPLTRRYFTILSLSADSRTKKGNFSDLIFQTGFTRLA